MSNNSVRVRFAPSPTGPLHLGGVRTALYNYLFARKNNGHFILRIEDTDQNRYVEGAEEYIVKSLNWCGLIFDEDPVKGGPFAPYRQSERSAIYREYIDRLLKSGYAYLAFDTADELEEARKSDGQFLYGSQTRLRMKNSLSLTADEVRAKLDSGERYVVRILIPASQEVTFHDLIRGEVRVSTDTLDDKVLFKSDGLPTYHLANVVDDFLMGITHVIRGEEWLPSAPLHLLLYRFFGWENKMPQFAHLPLILKPDGNGKLSKRDGDRLGFPVFPLEWKDPASGETFRGYKEDGYLPDSFLNMLALLGWNPGTDQEIFTLNELIQAFSLDRINKSGAKFDPAKARWFNHKYIQLKPDDFLLEYLKKTLTENDLSFDDAYLLKVIRLIKERLELLADLWKNSWYFFKAPENYDPAVKQKVWFENTDVMITYFIEVLASDPVFDKDSLHRAMETTVLHHSAKTGQLMNPLRLLTVGSSQGPGLFDIALTIGRGEFISRLERGIKNIR
jgi:glutamyl-tRNA synthetase